MTSWANASGRILVWVVVVLLVVTGGKQSQLLLQLKLSWVCKLEWSLMLELRPNERVSVAFIYCDFMSSLV